MDQCSKKHFLSCKQSFNMLNVMQWYNTERSEDRPSVARELTAGGSGGRCKPPRGVKGRSPWKFFDFHPSRRSETAFPIHILAYFKGSIMNQFWTKREFSQIIPVCRAWQVYARVFSSAPNHHAGKWALHAKF